MMKAFAQCRLAKEVLSQPGHDTSEITIEDVLEDGSESHDYEISLEDFNEQCKPVFDKISPTITDALASANIGKEQIDVILMAGGCSRIIKVQEII